MTMAYSLPVSSGLIDTSTPVNTSSSPNAAAPDAIGSPVAANSFPTAQQASDAQAKVLMEDENAPVTGDINATISGNIDPPIASSSSLLGLATTTDSSTPSTTVAGTINSAPATTAPKPTTSGTAILCARGTTMVTKLTSNPYAGSSGYYAIEEWSRYPDTLRKQNTSSGQTPNSSLSNNVASQVRLAPVLITGCTFSHRDVTSQTLCMNNIKVFYSFGQNFGDVTISGEILLGNFGNYLLAKNTVKTFVDFFWKYRVSNNLKPVTVSAVNEKFLTYLVGMDFGDIIPDVHILPFLLHGVLIDVSRDKKAVINPPSVMLTTADIFNTSVAKALAQTKGVDTSPTGVASSNPNNSVSGGQGANQSQQDAAKDATGTSLPMPKNIQDAAAGSKSTVGQTPSQQSVVNAHAIIAAQGDQPLTPTQQAYKTSYLQDSTSSETQLRAQQVEQENTTNTLSPLYTPGANYSFKTATTFDSLVVTEKVTAAGSASAANTKSLSDMAKISPIPVTY